MGDFEDRLGTALRHHADQAPDHEIDRAAFALACGDGHDEAAHDEEEVDPRRAECAEEGRKPLVESGHLMPGVMPDDHQCGDAANVLDGSNRGGRCIHDGARC